MVYETRDARNRACTRVPREARTTRPRSRINDRAAFFLFPSNNPIAVYQYYITFIRCIAVTRLDVRARTYTPLHARTHARAPIRFNLPAGYKTHQYLTNPCLHDTRRTSSSPVEKFFTSRQYTTQKTPKNNFRKYFSQKFIQLKKN